MLDLGVPHKKHREIAVVESRLMSLGYLTPGAGFGGWVLIFIGSKVFVADLMEWEKCPAAPPGA